MGAFFCLFVFGAVGWYVVMAFFGLWAFFIVEGESLTGGIFELVLCILFLQWIGNVNIFGRILSDPLLAVGGIVGYFVLGFIWSFIKWWLYVKDKAEELKKEKDEFFKRDGGGDESAINKVWIDQIHVRTARPKALEHKSGIAVWVIYWPFSFLWSLLNDILKKVVREIIQKINKWYQGISDRAFKGIDD